MTDSPMMSGESDEPEDLAPSAAELEAAGQSALFAAPDAPAASATKTAPAEGSPPVSQPDPPGEYRVLARKYRPQTFAELLGQDAMVQTLANAIKRDRIAHAFLMTGVRGVGKTSTARLIAKALNCIGPDGNGGPTISPCGECEPCRAIAEGRHIDVIEMDAASHTGVDDVREIIEAVRYAAVSARYKIYIVDEVHMLSRSAFNALLKTLEEPPAHVKFLFATTEVDKLPVTVLSRCQRFDLRRIGTDTLAAHFARICEAEGVTAEGEALAMIAAAAEGSARDGLSILDQAIAHAGLEADSTVSAERVREMLGLADRSLQRRLFAALVGADAKELLSQLAEQYELGVDPLAVVKAQMEIVHQIAVTQVGQAGADAKTAEERQAIEAWAAAIAPGQIHRLWQLLVRGYDEVRTAPDPLVATQMALLRMLHANEMPDPGELLRRLASTPPVPAAVTSAAEPAVATAAPMSLSIADVADRLERGGHLRLAQIARDWLRPIEVSEGTLRYQLASGMSDDPAVELRDALYRTTGTRWTVERAIGDAGPTLRELEEAARQARKAALLAAPLVKATLEAFPGAEVLEDGNSGKPDWSKTA